jgi:molybdopterin molybdotransferase
MSDSHPLDTLVPATVSSPACNHEGLISLDEALASYSTVIPLPVICLPLINAHQHILAEDVLSPVELPLFSQSAVDGYAINSADGQVADASLHLIGEIRAGSEQQLTLKRGQAIRIFTGGKIPAGADTVARQEIVRREQDTVQLMQTIGAGTDIRYQGEELAKGTKLANQGQYLNSGLIAALSMAGMQQVKVHRQPKIAVLITGDEVKKSKTGSKPTGSPDINETAPPNGQLDHDAQVFDANGPLISSWLKQQGYHSFDLQYVSDDYTELQQALDKALNQFDLVVTTGGVSVGDYDLIRPVSMQLGAHQIFWQVAQKPGKPLYFASFQNPQSGHQSYLMGLPGNPAAVLIGLHVHLQTLLANLQGKKQSLPQWQTGQFEGNLKADSRERLLRMQMHINLQGQVILTALDKQQSHMLSNLARSNALVRVAAHHQIKPPTILKFISLI